MINNYIQSSSFNKYTRLDTCHTCLKNIEKVFHTTDLKLMYGSVVMHNRTVVTVPVFDMKGMILSILHDTNLMREENVAEGLDIFTGAVDKHCEANEV